MADMIESTALDSTLLAGLQPLPHADRNRVVDRLARFDPPRDSRDDEAFYAWLLDHYRQYGSAEVDAALRSKGGNSARRTLSLAAALWAERALVSDGVEPFEVKGASLARLAELAREHGCLVAITILDWASRACAGEVARDDPPPGTVASGLAGDAPSPYDRLRSLLSRAEAESDLEVLASITRFADDLDQALLRIERQARSAAREAGRAAALRAYQDARAELPAGEASGLPDDPPGDGERLRATTIAMGTLSRALHVLMEARVARDSGAALSRAERQQRAIAVLDAEDDLVTARATLADLSTPDDADEQQEQNGGDAARGAIAPVDPSSSDAQAGATDLASDADPEPNSDAKPEELGPTVAEIAFATPTAEPQPGEIAESSEETRTSTDLELSLDDAIFASAAEPPIADDRPATWDRWVEMALAAGRPALATHLARAREYASADDDKSWPSVVLEAVIVGGGVTLGNDRATQRYEALALPLLHLVANTEGASDRDLGVVMATVAGALRPSLMASYAAVSVLERTRLVGPLQALHRLVDFAKDGPQLRLAAITDLAAPLEQSERLHRRNQAIAALSIWRDGERARTFPYQPATALWRDMLAKQGMIGGVVDAIVADAPSAAAAADQLTSRLRDDPDDVLDRAFSDSLKSPGALRMTGMARKAFLSKLIETGDLIESWRLVADTQKGRGDRLERHRERLASAIAAARSLAGASDGSAFRLGALLLMSVLDQLDAVLRGEPPLQHDGDRRFSDEIALLPNFPINGRTRFEVRTDDVVPLQRAAEIDLANGVPDASQALERALAIGAMGTARVLADQIGADQIGADQLGSSLDVHERIDVRTFEERRDLDQRRQSLRASLDDLQSASTGSDRTLNELEAILTGIEELDLGELPRAAFDADSIGDFPVLRQRLDTFAAQLEGKRAEVSRSFGDAIAELERDHGDLRDCRDLLGSGDLGTLAEDLSQIRQFGPDRTSTKPRSLLTGLQAFATDVLSAEPVTMPAVLRAIGDAQALGPFDFSRLPATELVDAETLARAWVALKDATGTASVPKQEAALRVILEALGFSGVKIAKNTVWRAGRRFDVRVDPLRSADDCIVPAFGSEAQGAYSLLVMGRGALEKSLAGLDDLPSGVIAFATEWLPLKTRREFLKRSRSRPAATALLDDAGAAALAATTGRTLRTFFNLAIPFGAARPYADTAAATSVEMFFGREEEYRQLVDPQGSSLVYGGRQLGKTALLKQVELRNRANSDFVVVYLDIKNVGSSVPPDLIWDRISEALSTTAVFAGERRASGRIEEIMVGWLAANPQRRILILLDEADNFLEAEMEGDFSNIVRIKSLMEETNRRLKLVFAGLHNVQRFVRTPNSPLLHFGEPVNIGPLLGPDRDAARRMVFEPMAAVGIGFERPSDAHHMLSLVGYYPSLLQTLGKSLLAAVDRQLARAGEPERLPVLLDRKIIVSTFATSSFRDELLSKFRKTLELDPRYELITYAVCLRADEDRSSGRITGLGYTARDIFDLAFYWWPQGFEGIRSADLFSALLDEMVGLGVLARQSDRFALRSARIAAMLGRRDQIENHLLHFSNRKLDRKADPLANHRVIDDRHSPISLRQERMLVDQVRADKPVAVVFFDGLEAAVARDALAKSVVSLAQLQNWPEPRPFEFRDLDGLRLVVARAKKDAREGRPQLIVCRGSFPSDADLSAIDSFRELRDRASPVRLFFLGQDDRDVALEACQRFHVLRSAAISIGPWDGEAIYHWLERHLDQADRPADLVDRVRGLTGGFSAVFDAVKAARHRVGCDELIRQLEQGVARALGSRTLGLGDPSMLALANALNDWNDEVDDEVLRDLARTALGEAGDVCIERAKRLGVVELRTAGGERRWTLNPAVARVSRVPR